MALTTKELMLIKDNIKMGQNSVCFLRGCSEVAADSQVKTLCNQMVDDHERDISILMKHLGGGAVQ